MSRCAARAAPRRSTGARRSRSSCSGSSLWQALVVAFDVQDFLLPKPTEIAQTFWDERSSLWHAGIYTFKEALGGFALGSSLGILSALLFANFRWLGTAFMPFAVAANAIPIIAFAPIINDWFGLLNPFSKMAIAAVLCFFPVMINTLRGLTSVDPRAIELMRSYAAGQVDDLPAGADPGLAAAHVRRPQDRERALDDRRDRRRVLRRPDDRARRDDPERVGVLELHGRVGRDRAGQRVRDPLLRRGRGCRAARDLVGSVAEGLPDGVRAGQNGPNRIEVETKGDG